MIGPSYKTGDFRHRVVLQKPLKNDDGQGGYQRYYEDLPSVWAVKRELKNAEVYRHQHIQNVTMAVFVIRNRQQKINNSWKLVYKNQVFDIVNVGPQDFDFLYVEITVSQCTGDS